jgi:serine/threonine-protein kinase
VRFGRFELKKRLSIGGTAEVFAAVDPKRVHGPRPLAVKRLLPSAEEVPDLVRMFATEALLATRFRHPRIARVLEVGEVTGAHYLVMELVEGRDLGRFRCRLGALDRSMPWQAVVAVGVQAADALAYVHEFVDEDQRPLQIVHRDVSPHNFIVERTGVLKLTDFGIAKFEGSETTQGGVLKGKHAYMSPEQVRRRPLDARSDLFSLGIVLFELLTGLRLFREDTLLATLERVEQADVPPILASFGPAPLRDAIMGCLERDPGHRPASASALGELLGSLEVADPEARLAELGGEIFGLAWDQNLDADDAGLAQLLSAAELEGAETTDQKQVTEVTRMLP